MELKDYEQRIGKSRHIEVKILCGQCGKEVWVKWIRVKVGQGGFCSRKCANIFRTLGEKKKYVGKENGKVVLDKTKNNYYVYWFEPETLKRKTTSYARWWWEVNKGKVPVGYRVSYNDRNSLNISPDNIMLISSKEFGQIMSNVLIGHEVDLETRKKISKANSGSSKWSGIVTEERYPKFTKNLKLKIKERDGYKCKVCGMDLFGFPERCRVHHIDGNKLNPDPENLVLVCRTCHGLIHSTQNHSNALVTYYRSKL